MKKQLQLIRVLLRCGKAGKAESNSAVGDTSTLITLAIGLACVVGMFFGGQYAAEHTALLGSTASIFTAVLAMAGILAFVMTLMNAINQLYISSDLDVLVTLPFTPTQIVTAKLVSVSILPLSICVGLVVPAAVGYFVKTEGLSALFIPAMLVGSLVLAIYVVSLTAILLMLIMRTFRFIRSRNFISVVTALLMFAIGVAYMTFSMSDQSLDEAQAVGIFMAISGTMSQMAVGLPSVGLTVRAACGEPLCLLYVLGIAIAAMILVGICAKALYFKAALGMTDANGVRGPVSEKSMKKNTTRIAPAKALARREVMNILRTPSMITNGYLYSIIFPFFVVGGIVVKAIDEVKLNIPTVDGMSQLEIVRETIRQLGIKPEYFLIGCSLFCMLMPCLAVMFSSLSRYLISREGKDFTTLKAMPISAVRLVTVKRNVAMLFNGISGCILPSLLLIVTGILGLIPLWICILCALGSFAWLLAMVDFCAIKDVNSPNLNWDNEAEVTKSNAYGAIIFGVVLALIILSIVLLSKLTGENPNTTLITVQGWVTAALPFLAAFVCEVTLRQAAAKLY